MLALEQLNFRLLSMMNYCLRRCIHNSVPSKQVVDILRALLYQHYVYLAQKLHEYYKFYI